MKSVTARSLVLGLLCGLPAAAQENWPQARPTRLEVSGAGLEQRVTLVATNANVEKLAQGLAEASGRVLEGLSGPVGAPALVTIELYDRPLTQVLEYMLGAVSLDYELTPGILRLVPGEDDQRNANELYSRSLATYLRSSKLYPDAREAERARLDQGEIELARGNLEAALFHFTALFSDYPSSALVPDAELAAADLLVHLERYAEAHSLYLQVTELSLGDPRRNRARLGLARCQMDLSNPGFTVLMLRRLESDSPTEDPIEKASRLLLLAQALERSQLPLESLGVLDELERLGANVGTQVEAMEVRAQCLEKLDYGAAAGRAWLVVARERRGAASQPAYRRAAQIALSSADPLAVLFIAKEAQGRGLTDNLTDLTFEARLRLGLAVDWQDQPLDKQLETARRYTEKQEGLGLTVWKALHRRAEEFSDPERLEIAQALARSLLGSEGLDQSLAVLASARPLDPNACDQLAGELCQKAREYDRATQAFLGRY